jgi:ABC-type dipeptide/oligopeptide/nickel transport system permease component
MVVVFGMLHLIPGDPVLLMLGEGAAVTPETIEALRDELGLNDPLYVQFGRFFVNALRGDWGRSIRLNVPVLDLIRQAAPRTLELAAAALLLAILLGMPLGIFAAIQRNGLGDRLSMLLALLGVSMPSFWFGILLIFFFAVRLQWFPITGQGGLARLFLPALTLSFSPMAIIARMLRSSLLEVMGLEYVVTARAKGLAERMVIFRHALKNALIPVVTVTGLELGRLLAGAFIVEVVFARVGLGRLAINGILNKDYPVVQGVVFFIGLVYVGINIVVDLSYAVLDPRVQY